MSEQPLVQDIEQWRRFSAEWKQRAVKAEAEVERLRTVLNEFLAWDEGIHPYKTRVQLVKLAREALGEPVLNEYGTDETESELTGLPIDLDALKQKKSDKPIQGVFGHIGVQHEKDCPVASGIYGLKCDCGSTKKVVEVKTENYVTCKNCEAKIERLRKRIMELEKILAKNIQELIMENPKYVVSEMASLIKECREANSEVERLRSLAVSLSNERWDLIDEVERRFMHELEDLRDKNLQYKKQGGEEKQEWDYLKTEIKRLKAENDELREWQERTIRNWSEPE